MIIDERIDGERLTQFASQTEHLEPAVIAQLYGMWQGDQGDEFNAGLLAGLAVGTVLAQNGVASAYLPVLTAFVASQIRQKRR